MTRHIALMTLAVFVLGCGGGTVPTRSPGQATSPATVAPPTAISGEVSAEQLCGLLTPADWQQFNYVTSAEPTVTSDGPGTAICQYAQGLFLEVYVDQNESEADATFDTVVDNVPMDDATPFYVQGAAQSVFDSDIGDDEAGLAAQAGRLTLFVSGLSRDTAQVELATLAGLVIARGASLV